MFPCSFTSPGLPCQSMIILNTSITSPFSLLRPERTTLNSPTNLFGRNSPSYFFLPLPLSLSLSLSLSPYLFLSFYLSIYLSFIAFFPLFSLILFIHLSVLQISLEYISFLHLFVYILFTK